jgi:hypothetical protein
MYTGINIAILAKLSDQLSCYLLVSGSFLLAYKFVGFRSKFFESPLSVATLSHWSHEHRRGPFDSRELLGFLFNFLSLEGSEVNQEVFFFTELQLFLNCAVALL